MTQFIILRHAHGGLFAIPVYALRHIAVTEAEDGYVLSVETADAWYVAREDSDRDPLEKLLQAIVKVLASGRCVDMSDQGSVCPF
jgi:hypothetical protein